MHCKVPRMHPFDGDSSDNDDGAMAATIPITFHANILVVRRKIDRKELPIYWASCGEGGDVSQFVSIIKI